MAGRATGLPVRYKRIFLSVGWAPRLTGLDADLVVAIAARKPGRPIWACPTASRLMSCLLALRK
jgi:hypothetical protein